MARRFVKIAGAALALFLAIAPANAQKSISAAEAKDHIGENATVCGQVAIE